jgi:PASTA domain
MGIARGVLWRRVAVALLLGATGLLVVGESPTMAAAPGPSGSATISEGSTEAVSPAGTGNATVQWSADCPNPEGEKTHYWSVSSDAYHQDGSHANHQSTAESGGNAMDSGTHGLVLQMASGLLTETFHVQVELTCSPNPDTIIGDLSITLTRSAEGTGGSGGGSGGSGTSGGGTGGGGTPGNGGGAPGSGGAIHCVVPKLAGRTVAKAKRLLEAAHCKLGRVSTPKHRRETSLVVRASVPRQGTRLPRGTRVRLTLRRA